MSPILTGVIASGISGRLSAGPVGSFDALATVTAPSGGLSSITFSGIPAGYRHLQVRAIHLYSGTGSNLRVTYNSGSSNAISHFAFGNGGSGSTGSGADNSTQIISFQSGTTTTAFCAGVWDFLDYSSTTKAKVLRGLVGQETNGAGIVGIVSALNTSTDAIESMTFSYNNGASFVQNTQFALYGIR